jgi:hypothetical protein
LTSSTSRETQRFKIPTPKSHKRLQQQILFADVFLRGNVELMHAALMRCRKAAS